MKIVVAIDSFKGSASSVEVNRSVEKAIKLVLPDANIKMFPIADGGEGTLEALEIVLGGEYCSVSTIDLMGQPIQASFLKVGNTAFIESASVIGIDKITPSPETFEQASSFGLGVLLKEAVHQGCQEIYLTLGGTGSSDGGLGLLESFGFDEKTFKLQFPASWEDVRLTGLTDVQNIYAGKSGFAHVFGKQKGGSDLQVEARDQVASDFALLVKEQTGIDLQAVAGSGAAGGLGAAILLLGGRLESGFDRIASVLCLEEDIKDADLVITGEGRLDSQSKEGKVPYGLASLAKKHGVPIIAICGMIADDTDWIGDDFLGIFSIQKQVLSLQQAMDKEETLGNLEFVTRNILQVFVKNY